MSQQETSGWAIGWILFAGVMMMMAGVFQSIAGIAGIAQDELYAVTSNWIFQFDVTTWGWIHLIFGIVLVVAGYGVIRGNVAARTFGVVLAGLSAIVNFAYLPWYPVWGIIMIAVDIGVIWALTMHGRDFENAPIA